MKHHGLWISLILSLAASDPALAQQKTPLSLDTILHRLQSNLDRYDKEVPSYFCSEHAVSSMFYGKVHETTVTDSLFRVKRNESGSLIESHEIKAPDGASSNRQFVDGLVSLSGVFSGGLNAVSLKQTSCMHYTLQPILPGHLDEPYVVEFATEPNANRISHCVLKEEGTGRVLIDPSTMQVTRMELTAPHHAVGPADAGIWKVLIVYAPVSLAGRTFWLPTTITSSETSSTETLKGKNIPTVYSFSAHYSDYHKLEVSSRIVPAQ